LKFVSWKLCFVPRVMCVLPSAVRYLFLNYCYVVVLE
jgi:hypothetical protein